MSIINFNIDLRGSCSYSGRLLSENFARLALIRGCVLLFDLRSRAKQLNYTFVTPYLQPRYLFPTERTRRVRAGLLNPPNHRPCHDYFQCCVQGIIFPLELFPRFVHHRARLTFLLSLYFFIPSFLFSLRFKVVIFSRPPFFQPVPRFVSLLIFFFGRSCAPSRFRSSRPSSSS